MNITNVPSDMSREKLRDILSGKYERHKIEFAPLNKGIVIFPVGNTLVRMIIKKNRIVVKSGPNTKNPLITMFMVLGVLSGLIGLVLFFAIIYGVNGKKYKQLRKEAGEYVQNALNGTLADKRLEEELKEV